jgi:hypothetical protein
MLAKYKYPLSPSIFMRHSIRNTLASLLFSTAALSADSPRAKAVDLWASPDYTAISQPAQETTNCSHYPLAEEIFLGGTIGILTTVAAAAVSTIVALSYDYRSRRPKNFN